MEEREKKVEEEIKEKNTTQKEKEIKTSFCGVGKINFYSLAVDFWGERENNIQNMRKEKRNKNIKKTGRFKDASIDYGFSFFRNFFFVRFLVF